LLLLKRVFISVQLGYFPTFGKNHLLNSSPIVHSKAFEAAITKLCDNKSDELTNVEAMSVMFFFTEDEENVSGMDIPLADQVIKKRKRMNSRSYNNVKWIPPTSNEVERFFSICGQVYTKYRKSLNPVNLEMQLFLKLHTEIWLDDGKLVSKIYNENQNKPKKK